MSVGSISNSSLSGSCSSSAPVPVRSTYSNSGSDESNSGSSPTSTSPAEFASDKMLRDFLLQHSAVPVENGLAPVNPQIDYQGISQALLANVELPRSDSLSPVNEEAIQHAVELMAIQVFEICRRSPHLSKDYFKKFPLGADLHNHLCGAVLGEVWLRLAEKYKLFFCQINNAFIFSKTQDENYRPIQDLINDPVLSRQFRNVTSMQGAQSKPACEGGQHFFDTFSSFESAAQCIPLKDQIEAAIMSALNANTEYLELMVDVIDFKDHPPLPEEYFDKFDSLYGENKYSELLDILKPWADRYCTEIKAKFDAIEKVDSQDLIEKGFSSSKNLTDINNPLVVQFLADVSRLYDPPRFYAAINAVIQLCQSDSRFLGFTIAGPEHDYNAIKYFPTQMAIIRLLCGIHNFTNFTLHAGELVAMLTDEGTMQNRIKDSLATGAKRLGHCACLSDSADWLTKLIPEMKAKDCLVEVCFSSNEAILGLTEKKHPVVLLQQHEIAWAAGSDDGGVTRSPLWNEYLKLAQAYPHFTYQDFKRMAYNSISYSFLPGDSIYESRKTYELKPLFTNLKAIGWKRTPEQREFLSKHPKAKMEARLVREFVAFENVVVPEMWSLYIRSKIRTQQD